AFCDDSSPWRASIDLVAASTAAARSLSARSAAERKHSARSRAPIFLASQASCDGRKSSAAAAAEPILERARAAPRTRLRMDLTFTLGTLTRVRFPKLHGSKILPSAQAHVQCS